ncbi:hypothetical protein [Phenylobacterium montanum]|uniref:Pentapeptide MXKDX repeat protein n=1 Tax=Phenylobacterium montanum TaxID=2823693 RepID=A0A975FZ54_9CAUL|nr:hypothetical protein [Caulobacter sp. S6]QUD87607.1 hypothetical protein KCG34_21565 [Caulobacter sp. S6]
MSLKVVLAGLSATVLIAAPLAAFAQEPPSAPIPYSELAAKDAAMDKGDMKGKGHHHKGHHHKAMAKAEKKADDKAAKPADAGH